MPGGEYATVYESEDDLARALLEEMDLEKSASAKGNIVDFQGIPIVIESPAGSERHWKAADGSAGTTHMLHPYGYVKRTNGLDSDEVDVYVGPNPRALMVYVVEQGNPNTGTHDEQKCMVGFSNEKRALEAYRAHLDEPERFELGVLPMEIDAFKRWLGASKASRGELDQQHTALVLPLQKAKGRPEMIARGDEHQGDRGPTHTGMAGVNIWGRAPRTAASPQPNRMAQQTLMGDRGKRRPMKADPLDYLLDRPHPVEPKDMQVDASFALGENERTEMAERTLESLEAQRKAKLGYENPAEMGDDETLTPAKGAE